jgi:hypothetical protein
VFLYDFRRRLLFGHQLDVPGIAQLIRQLGNPTAGDTDKIDGLEFGLTDMSWIRARVAAVLAHVGIFEFGWITQMPLITRHFTTGFTGMRFGVVHLGMSFPLKR